ncbi:transposase [Sphingopyxis sp. C-1]|uniref:transposase n=1 Tax=Sphingopyxis sp. C-1 TaxID=262667 RepID=UPI000AC03338|nr:transposase [Sphingopyxis sp. C-1]
MARHRSHSVEFKRQVAQKFLSGETLHGLAKRHEISRQLIRVWVEKYEAGALDEDTRASDLIQAYEARIIDFDACDRPSLDKRYRGSHRTSQDQWWTINGLSGRQHQNLGDMVCRQRTSSALTATALTSKFAEKFSSKAALRYETS